MAWNAPFTAIDGTIFTAAQFNTFVRDNILETMPSKASVRGSLFTTDASNRIAERTASSAMIQTGDHSESAGQAEGTTETQYVDLPTTGPVVSVITGTQAWVSLYCASLNSAGNAAWMSYDVSGATTSAAADDRAVQLQNTGGQQIGVTILHNGLTPGLNTFTAKYRISTSGTGLFNQRRLAVQPL
jgi:hypothetical protein